jgi:phytoene desaturase
VTDKTVIVIGSGFAGLSAASFMAKQGWQVTVLEKNSTQWSCLQLRNGFSSMGPSFYWMPDVFERYFEQFGKKTTDYYSLRRLDTVFIGMTVH